MFIMVLRLLLVLLVSVSGNEFWNYKGCFPVSKLLLTAIFDIRGENNGETYLSRWSNCVKIMTKNEMRTIGLVKGGECYGCRNCSVPTYKVRGQCPDYGAEDRVQVFSLESDRSLIPDKYKHCSSGLCNDIHPLAYRDHNTIDISNDNRIAQVLSTHCVGDVCIISSLLSSLDCASVYREYQVTANQENNWPPSETIPDGLKVYDPRIPQFSNVSRDNLRSNRTHSTLNSAVLEESLLASDTLFPLLMRGSIRTIVANKTGVVLGSATPWIEANLLQIGAAHVITVEYKPILSLVPDITTLTPVQLASRYLADNWSPVDFAFSYSSIEHSGLGRYGDPVDSEGDLRAMRQISCLLKPGGVLFLSVPTGPDALVYNLHRIYGRYRLPQLLDGWDIVEVVGDVGDLDDVPVPLNYEITTFVLRKPKN